MKPTIQSWLAVACAAGLFACIGCESGPKVAEEPSVDRQFKQALKECKLCKADLFGAIFGRQLHIWLPESVDAIVGRGKAALPLLDKYVQSASDGRILTVPPIW